ncbi:MAG: elongation factor 1-beta [Candidatus Nanohaloarchaea archaeon]
MGNIAVVLRLMPEDADTDLEEVKEKVRDRIDVDEFGTEEVAFGLKALMVSTMTSDEEGGTDYLENQLEDIDEIQSVEVEKFNKV